MGKQWDSEDEQIYHFVEKVLEYQMSEIPGEDTLREKYRLSDLFYRKMECLIQRQERNVKNRAILRGIGAAAAVLLILFLLAAPEYAANAANHVFERFSEYVSFRFVEKADINWVPKYRMEYVPEGYELVKDAYYEAMGVITYSDKNGSQIDLTYGLADGTLRADSENKELQVLKGEGKQKIYYLKGDGNSSITWCSEDEITMFHLSGTLTEKELMDIYRGIIAEEE